MTSALAVLDVPQVRLLDTREEQGPFAPGEIRSIVVPLDGVRRAEIKLTVLEPTAPGWAAVYSTKTPTGTSLVNFTPTDVDDRKILGGTQTVAVEGGKVWVHVVLNDDQATPHPVHVLVDLMTAYTTVEIDVDLSGFATVESVDQLASATAQVTASLSQRITELEEADPPPAGPGGVGYVGDTYLDFETFFTAGTIEGKVQQMIDWLYSQPGNQPSETIALRQKVYSCSIPLHWVSGWKMHGLGSGAAREFSRSTVWRYTGASGTSAIIFPYDANPRRAQPAQGYPDSDYAPRNVDLRGILFAASAGRHWSPKFTPTAWTNESQHRVLWISSIIDCGWNGFDTIYWGWWDGVHLGGDYHVQACADTPFFTGGSENRLGGSGDGFVDNSTPAWAASGKPFIRSVMDKSFIGGAMLSARGASYGLSVEGGHALTVLGEQFDSPTGTPTYGSAIKIIGGDGIVIEGCSLKGIMDNPELAVGKTAANRGWIDIRGGRNIVIQGNHFANYQQIADPSLPVVWVGPNVGDNEVQFGLNSYPYFSGPAQIHEARSGRIYAIPSPKVALRTAA